MLIGPQKIKYNDVALVEERGLGGEKQTSKHAWPLCSRSKIKILRNEFLLLHCASDK